MSRPFTLPPPRTPPKQEERPPPSPLRGTEKYVMEAEERLTPFQRSRLTRVDELVQKDQRIVRGLP